MQQNFMEEVEKRGKERIESKVKKQNSLSDEICILTTKIENLQDDIYGLTKEQETF